MAMASVGQVGPYLVALVLAVIAIVLTHRDDVHTSRSEDDYNRAFCASVGGRTEVRHYYDYPGGRGYVVLDCETDTHVYEGGLDKRSSLDSVQQALFFAHLTGKVPVVVIYDTDGKLGKYEYRIRSVCEGLGQLRVLCLFR